MILEVKMRSLAVIFLADVVGYSKMMAQDEAGTLEMIRGFTRDSVRPLLDRNHGSLIKSLGDGWLVEFKSAVDAVNCAFGWHEAAKKNDKLSLRIGIHLGDVEHDEGPPPDVFGDTVNIAARLESIAETGDTAISTSVYLCLDQAQAKAFNNCGKQNLKNIATAVEVWSTGNLNAGSKGMNRADNKPSISIKPMNTSVELLSDFAAESTNSLFKYLNQKDWIDALVQKDPSETDYQLLSSISQDRTNFEIDVILRAPGGKTLWSGGTSGSMNQVTLLADSVGQQLSNQIFLEIAKVRDKYK